MSAPTTFTLDEFLNRVNRGVFFSVQFVKRTGEGEVREMLARRGVKKWLAGGELKFDPANKNLVSVHDARIIDRRSAYRFFNLEGLRTVKIGGKVYKWNFDSKTFTLIEGALNHERLAGS